MTAIIISLRFASAASGFTVFVWGDQPLAFCRQVATTSATPVGPGAVAVHPMDEPYPVQVITPAAAGMGTLTLELYELYGEKAFQRLSRGSDLDFSSASDIVDIFVTQAASPLDISIVKIIRPPKLRGRESGPFYEIYHGCVITNILDGETIEVGTMEILKQVTVSYRYVTWGSFASDAKRGFALRDRAYTLPRAQ
jgi:hypothetical protein